MMCYPGIIRNMAKWQNSPFGNVIAIPRKDKEQLSLSVQLPFDLVHERIFYCRAILRTCKTIWMSPTDSKSKGNIDIGNIL